MQDERRRSSDVQLGYLRGKVEALDAKIDSHLIKEASGMKKLSDDIASLRDDLNMYKHFLFFIRTSLACLAAALALNWDHTRELWFSLTHPPHK